MEMLWVLWLVVMLLIPAVSGVVVLRELQYEPHQQVGETRQQQD